MIKKIKSIDIKKFFLGKSLGELKKFYNNRGIIGILLSIITIILTYNIITIPMYQKIKDIYYGKYYNEYNKLDKLYLSYQRDYLIELFGKPPIKNILEGGYIEEVFIQDGYLLKAISDNSGEIIGIGITCKDYKFNYRIGGIILCKSLISEIPSEYNPMVNLDGLVGPKDITYYEKYGGSGVYGYRNYYFGINSNGYINLPDNFDALEFNKKTLNWQIEDINKDNYIRLFRENTIINSYFVTQMDIVDNLIDFSSNYLQLNYGTSIRMIE